MDMPAENRMLTPEYGPTLIIPEFESDADRDEFIKQFTAKYGPTLETPLKASSADATGVSITTGVNGKPRGTCSSCRNDLQLRKDGTLPLHSGCEGSHRPPL